MVEKCMLKTLKPVYYVIKKANKEFYDNYGEEKIEKSIRFC